jgi:hypothetical protein
VSDDTARVGGVVFDLAPQTAEVRVQSASVVEIVSLPDPLHKMGTADDLTGRLHQRRQQERFHRVEMERGGSSPVEIEQAMFDRRFFGIDVLTYHIRRNKYNLRD